MIVVVKVWDPVNEDEDGARVIECTEPSDFVPDEDDAIELAVQYAERDTDGEIDGIYNNGHVIIVLFRMPITHKRFVVNVKAEYEPQYYGEVKRDK